MLFNVTHNSRAAALVAHLNKIPDFYTRLGVMKEGIGDGEPLPSA